MRSLTTACALLLILGAGAVIAAPEPGEEARETAVSSSCIACHAQMGDDLAEPTVRFGNDVHAEAGLGCESCHGGDPSHDFDEDAEAAMNPAKGFEPAPGRLEIAAFCARCHSDATFMKRYNPQARVDQLAEYLTSVHGQKNAAGDPVPAVCTDCHGVHGIRPVTSPDSPVYATNVPNTCAHCHSDAAMMAPYGIPTNQLETYLRSMHAAALIERGDTAAPACNDCHGNHGAAPPGVRSVANVCGQCHGRESTLFQASFKKELFEATEVAECTVCHDHHRIRHPTPELFHSASAPEAKGGTVRSKDPFSATFDEIAPGAVAEATWRTVLRPHVEAGDERLIHRIEITAEGMDPLTLDATVRPGDSPRSDAVISASSAVLGASLTIQAMSGLPVEAGDAILLDLRLEVSGSGSVRNVLVRDQPGQVVDPLAGSACLTCHTPGDDCDKATERMYVALTSLDRDLRASSALLRRAELAGMLVSEPQFELKSKGVTAAVEARALIHSFDPDRLVSRVDEGKTVAAETLQAGQSALDELQFRRKGLAVSLVLVGLVLVALFLKIRQTDQMEREQAGRA